jgi:hypothetical protein
MRVSVSAMVLILTIALSAMGQTPTEAPPMQPAAPPVSGNLADDVAAQEQPCECEREPGLLGTVFGRFLNPTECDPHWSFTGDGVALQRSSTRSQRLLSRVNPTTELLDSRHLDFPASMGFQLSAIRRGPCGWEWELGYFHIDSWNADFTSTGTSFMTTSSDGTGYLVTNGEAHYTSRIYLAEVNLRRQWCDGLTVLVGFRAGELNESYTASGVGTRTAAPVSLNIGTFNHLYGFQTGADYEFYNMGGPLRISALCKAGIYGNSAMQSTERGTGDGTLADHRYQAAFMGEAGAVATYQVTCHLSLRASCQAVWIEGVALAPEQIGANDFTGVTAGIDTHGGVFYYGGGLGAELKF